jgi:tungstate transport system ATP-binding protein
MSYFGRTVLDVEHLAVEEGEVLAVLGPSGSGKSVLLRVLNLLEEPTAGVLRFHGREVQGLERHERAEISRSMAMIFQDALLFRGTVQENVAYGLKIRKVPVGERAERVSRILDTVGLSDRAGAYVSTLSGGEAQRTSVARALVIGPEVLFFDEPFANLDVQTRHSMQEQSRAILKESRTTSVFVTHDQEEAARMGDRILVLNGGRVSQEGTARDIFYSPRNEFVARFVGVDNVYEGEVVRSVEGLATVSVDGTEIEVAAESAAGSRIKIGIRPEDVTLAPVEEAGGVSSSRNTLIGEVKDVQMRGPLARVVLECPIRLQVLVTRRSAEEMGIEPGRRFAARFKATAVVAM